jgi:WD40 repeat protein
MNWKMPILILAPAAVAFLICAAAPLASAQSRPETRWIKTRYFSRIYETAISPDGLTLAAVGDTRIDLYNLADGKCLRSLQARDQGPETVAWSPDGSRLVAAGFGHIWLFRASDGVMLARSRTSYQWQSTRSAAFSPDGQFVIVAMPEGTTLDIRRSSDLGLARRLAVVGAQCVAYSPDGASIAVGYTDGRIRKLDVVTGATQATLSGHTARVNDVAFSPDGAMLVSGSNDGTGRIWNVATGSSVQLPGGSSYPVDQVDYASDGSRVATAGYPYLTVWTAPAGAQVQRIATSGTGAVSLAPGGATVIGALAAYHLGEWNIGDGALVREFTAPGPPGYRVAMDPAGTRVASAGSSIQVYQASDGQLVGDIGTLGFPVGDIAWSPDGTVVHAVHADTWPSTDSLVSAWEVATGNAVAQFSVAEGDAWAAAFAGDVSRVAVANSSTVAVYDVATGARLWDVAIPYVQQIAASPDGSRVAIIDSYTLDVRNMADGTPVLSRPISALYGYAWSVAFSPDGAEVAVGTFDGYVLLVDVASGNVVARRPRPYAVVMSVDYTRDGSRLIVGTTGQADDAAQIVRRSDGRVLAMYGVEVARGIARADTDPAVAMWCYARGDGTVVMADMPDTSAEALIGLQGTSGVVGSQVELQATLTDPMGAPLVGKEVHFFRDGAWFGRGYIGTSATDGSGVARISYALDAPTGSRPVFAAYGGGQGYMFAETGSFVQVMNPTTRMFMLNRSGAIDSAVGIRAFLTLGNGSPIPNQSLAFTLAGSGIGSAQTDINGRATLWYVIPNTVVPGTHPIASSFAGDATYPAASAGARLTVTEGSAYIWVMPRTVQKGTAAYLRSYVRSARLLTGLPGLDIAYTLDGTAIGTATTDASGRTALLHAVPGSATPGDLTLECSFAGNAHYLPASGSALITVTP